MPRSGKARSYSRFIYSFSRNFHSHFYSGYISLYSHQQCLNVLLCSPPCQYSLPFLCTHRLLHLTILSEKFLFHKQWPLLGGPTTGQCTETGACSALNGISTSHHVLSGDQELLQRRGRKIVRGREIRNDHSKTV